MYKHLVKLLNHHTAFRILKWFINLMGRIPAAQILIKIHNRKTRRPELGLELFGLHFINPIGLGPGIDKTGSMFHTLDDYGFSFIEIGPIDSSSVKTVLNNIQRYPTDAVTFLNINKDHQRTFTLAYDFADVFVIDVLINETSDILESVLSSRLTYDNYKPILLRISHEIQHDELVELLNFCMLEGIDGLVVANADTVRRIDEITAGRLPIIAYGGVRSAEKAKELLDCGASLVEVTTGLIIDGPSIAKTILKDL